VLLVLAVAAAGQLLAHLPRCLPGPPIGTLCSQPPPLAIMNYELRNEGELAESVKMESG